MLSKRSQQAEAPMAAYKAAYFETRSNRYSDDNPNGVMSLTIAENRLSAELVVKRINEVQPLPEDQLFYGTGCRAAIAKFMSTHITNTAIHMDSVIPAPGASGAIDLLLYTLCDDDDSILIVAPGYNGIKICATTRNRVHLVICQLDETNNFKLNSAALDSRWHEAGGESSTIRCVFITSPMNPTGEVIPKETILDIVTWARQRKLHCIFDEVYALSCFRPNVAFVSVAEALDNKLEDDVHIIWGLSKDFCSSGLRMGAIISHNLQLISRLWPAATLSGVSRYSQFAVGELLNDTKFCVDYIAENRHRLNAAYKTITALLDHDGVNYIPASAGTFVFIDLSRFLGDTPSLESELKLFKNLYRNAGVILSPASDTFSSAYGWFRLCYSSISEQGLREAWRRIRKLFNL